MMEEQLNRIMMRRTEILKEMTMPSAQADSGRMQALLKEQAELEPIAAVYEKYEAAKKDGADSRELLAEETDPEMRKMLTEEAEKAGEKEKALLEELNLMLLPKDPDDEKNVILEIRAGAGGDEAALFAAELYRMYQRYAESMGWKVELMSLNENGIGGFKECTAGISGKGVYAHLKFESGTHRVQRVPSTESGGRIHTSTVTVAIMPEAGEVEVEIDPKDLRFDVFRASGNGGQCVNTTDSAVRLTHIPTGIVISCQDEKSQLKNRAKALKVLRARLYDRKRQEMHDARSDLRRSQVGTGDRSEKIRTYNFPQGRVTDHRIHLTLHRIGDVIGGDLGEIIDTLIRAEQAKKLAGADEKDI